jgi:hypothetical protein
MALAGLGGFGGNGLEAPTLLFDLSTMSGGLDDDDDDDTYDSQSTVSRQVHSDFCPSNGTVGLLLDVDHVGAGQETDRARTARQVPPALAPGEVGAEAAAGVQPGDDREGKGESEDEGVPAHVSERRVVYALVFDGPDDPHLDYPGMTPPTYLNMAFLFGAS